MKRRIGAIALGIIAVVMPMSACQLITGIHEYEDNVDSAAPATTHTVTVTVGAEPEPGTPCPFVHVPSSDPNAGSNVTLPIYFAIDNLDFDSTGDDGGSTGLNGFDLDNVCTGYDAGPKSEFVGSSCVVPNGAAFPLDPAGGVDDALQSIIGQAAGVLGPSTVLPEDTRIHSGIQTIVFQLTGFTGARDADGGLTNANNLTIGVYTSEQLEVTDDCDAGIAHLADASVDAGDGAVVDNSHVLPPMPERLGCDIWSLSTVSVDHTFPQGVAPSKIEDTRAYLVNGKLVAHFASLELPIAGTETIEVDNAQFDADLVEVPGAKGMIYKLENGRLGGQVSTTSLLNSFKYVSVGNDGTGICQGQAYYDGLKQRVCSLADLAGNADAGHDAPCDAISFGARVGATQIRDVGLFITPNPHNVQDNCKNVGRETCAGNFPEDAGDDDDDGSLGAVDASDSGGSTDAGMDASDASDAHD